MQSQTREILETAYKLQNDILNIKDIEHVMQLHTLYHEIDRLYKDINQTTEQIKLIRQNTKIHITKQIQHFKKEIDVLIKPNNTYEELKQLDCGNDLEMECEAAPGIKLPVIHVLSEDFIPSTPLYYIADEKQFAVKINGIIIKGQIGSLYEGNKKYIKCHEVHQPNFDYIKRCSRWHPQYGEPIGWHPKNFLTISESVTSKNQYMRHIGNRDTLDQDIQTRLTTREKEMRSKQIMHDLLIQLCINRNRNRKN